MLLVEYHSLNSYMITSLLITIFLFIRSNNLHPLVKWYPTWIIWLDSSSIFLLSWSGTCIYAMDPNTFKWLKLGLTPNHYSSYVTPSNFFVRYLFSIYVAIDTTLTHSSFGRWFHFNVLLNILILVMFFISTIPFCWGVYGDTTSCISPSFIHSVSKYFDTYYPPPSVLKTLILWPLYLSTIALNLMKTLMTSLFLLIK